MLKALSRWIDPSRRATWHFGEAIRYYQAADAENSLRHFQERLKINQDWFVWFQMSIVYSELLGDIEGSLWLLRHARRLRERLYAGPGVRPPYRYLEYFWAGYIGHIANMEHLIKREILCGRDPKNILLFFS